jgi:transcription elongation factor Elf1
MDRKVASFVTELKTQVKHTCTDCREYTLLVYLVMNDQGQMFGVCKECGANYSTPMHTP